MFEFSAITILHLPERWSKTMPVGHTFLAGGSKIIPCLPPFLFASVPADGSVGAGAWHCPSKMSPRSRCSKSKDSMAPALVTASSRANTTSTKCTISSVYAINEWAALYVAVMIGGAISFCCVRIAMGGSGLMGCMSNTSSSDTLDYTSIKI